MLNYKEYYKKQCRLDPKSMINQIESNVTRGIYSRAYADQLISKIKNTHDNTNTYNRT